MSTIIAVLPDERYASPHTRPHVTMAYFPDDITFLPEDVARLESSVKSLAQYNRPMDAYTDARSIFSDESGPLIVDLVNCFRLTDLRHKIERLYSPFRPGGRFAKIQMDDTYGFIPHMTVCHPGDYMGEGEPFQEFTFDRIALWYGDYRVAYEFVG